MAAAFSEEGKKKFDQEMARHPDRQAALIPVLHLAQGEFGFLSQEVMEYVAGIMEIPVSTVYRVATFYTMFNKKPVGKYHVQVCHNLSCSLLGAEDVLEYIARKLNIKVGETTTDNKFTLSRVECLGSCGTAPMMQINDRYHEDLTQEKIDKILNELLTRG